MKNIQDNKDKATLLQQHLDAAGIKVPRSTALNVIAKLEGYRSHTVAKRGASHPAAQAAFVPVLYSGTFMHPDVQASYVANCGKHCPYCGGAAVFDALEAVPDIALWDVRMGCHTCDKQWYATYELSRINGVHVQATALANARDGNAGCAYCGHAEVEYSTFVPGPEGFQMVSCKRCHQSCVHVYSLTNLAELDPSFAGEDDANDTKPEAAYLVSEGWGHLFGPGMPEVITRFVFDQERQVISHMQLLQHGSWVMASNAQMRDVEDSLTIANADALDSPEDWDLYPTQTLPDWAVAVHRD